MTDPDMVACSDCGMAERREWLVRGLCTECICEQRSRAADELYAACKAALEFLVVQLSDDVGNDQPEEPIIDQLRAAIAKAEGEGA